MVKEIRIYIEGIGDTDDLDLISKVRPGFRSGIRSGKETTAGLRPGFKQFFEKLYDMAGETIKINPILCGSRRDAYDDFKLAIESHQEAFNILLIDSESPISVHDNTWEHLRNRKEDYWIDNDLNFKDEQCHLMVQTMEAWLIADLDALKQFYENNFKSDKIEPYINKGVENISKRELIIRLNAATRDTKRGKYHKTQHAPELLKLLDVAKVRQAAPYCDRLFTTLEQIIKINSE